MDNIFYVSPLTLDKSPNTEMIKQQNSGNILVSNTTENHAQNTTKQ